MWRFRGADTAAAAHRVHAAIDAGLTLFDTADVYGPDNGEPFGAAEELLGAVIRESPNIREKVLLATKGGISLGVPYCSQADYLVAACEASLRRLAVDHVDLYQIHRPDFLAHPEEVARALDKLRSAGKIQAAGVSNYLPFQTAALAAILPFPLASIQPEFSALEINPLDNGVLDQAMALNLGVMAWSPLGGGRLLSPADVHAARTADALTAFASEHKCTVATAALAWVMHHPARPIPIVGSQDPQRIRDAAAATTVVFSHREWYAILVASRGEPLP